MDAQDWEKKKVLDMAAESRTLNLGVLQPLPQSFSKDAYNKT